MNELEHYGVKGMKWGVRHEEEASPNRARSVVSFKPSSSHKKVVESLDSGTLAAQQRRKEATNKLWEEVSSKSTGVGATRGWGNAKLVPTASGYEIVGIKPNMPRSLSSGGISQKMVLSDEDLQKAIDSRSGLTSVLDSNNPEYFVVEDLKAAQKQKEEMKKQVFSLAGTKLINKLSSSAMNKPISTLKSNKISFPQKVVNTVKKAGNTLLSALSGKNKKKSFSNSKSKTKAKRK